MAFVIVTLVSQRETLTYPIEANMETPYTTFKELLEEHSQELADKFYLLVPYGASLSKQEQADLQMIANKARALAARKRYI